MEDIFDLTDCQQCVCVEQNNLDTDTFFSQSHEWYIYNTAQFFAAHCEYSMLDSMWNSIQWMNWKEESGEILKYV